MATHTDEHIERALEAFARATRRERPPATAKRETSAFFVTGTDTGVGKTVVSAAIARCFVESGRSVAVFKPIQTGTIDGADDASYVARISGCDAHVGVALPDPLAPSVAADLADAMIDVDALVDRLAELRERYDVVVIEGAGGLLVPVDEDGTMADLAAAFDVPLVVVARPALGTLNHTALTIEAARTRGLDVCGIVISAMPASPAIAELTNPSELEKLCDAPLIGVLPHLEGVDVERGVVPESFDPAPWLGPQLGGGFDREAFLASLRDEAHAR